MTKLEQVALRWAGQVQKQKIGQLYEGDPNGMHDEEKMYWID